MRALPCGAPSHGETAAPPRKPPSQLGKSAKVTDDQKKNHYKHLHYCPKTLSNLSNKRNNLVFGSYLYLRTELSKKCLRKVNFFCNYLSNETTCRFTLKAHIFALALPRPVWTLFHSRPALPCPIEKEAALRIPAKYQQYTKERRLSFVEVVQIGGSLSKFQDCTAAHMFTMFMS